jgi:voltage-gated potassium channel
VSHVERHAESSTYQLFMLILCLLALAALAAETMLPLTPATREILGWADTTVCAIFFIDFWVQLAHAPNRWRYLVSWGWIDLLSSIPTVNVLRFGRVARVLRVLRVLRGVRSTKLIAEFLLTRRAQGAFLAASLLSLLLVVAGSIAILELEAVEGANIRTAQDAIWWAIVTLTTVGYGDRFPVTGAGRIVAVVLMVAGIGLFGAVSGFVASWFVQPAERETESDVQQLRAEVAAIRDLLERQHVTG